MGNRALVDRRKDNSDQPFGEVTVTVWGWESLQYGCLADRANVVLLQIQLLTLIPLRAYALSSCFREFTSSQRG